MSDKKQIEFVEGLRVYAPHENAPDYIKANCAIDCAELIEWLRKRGDKEVRIDICESRNGGKLYAKVNDYKPRQRDAEQPARNDDSEPSPF